MIAVTSNGLKQIVKKNNHNHKINSEMEIIGKIKNVLPLQTGTSQRGPWAKATVVIEYKSGNYFNTLALENMSKAEEFSKLTLGGIYTFYVEPTSREYQGRWYTQCTCFNWVPFQQTQTQPQQPAQPVQPAQPQQPAQPATDMPTAW